jgi:hypothetical protein
VAAITLIQVAVDEYGCAVLLQVLFEELHQPDTVRVFQHGFAETTVGTSATHTGASCGAYASGVTGSFGTIHYAIQGNVLTGSPVITLAEQAFVDTPGDLPAKTMAAMEAARSMGGDGRCSCDRQNPTGCGSPPPSFEKSAHVGFLLVSRFGDTDDPACTAAGCADGDYFMAFNIAFQQASDPDPVYQLQALFDDARLDLLGRPDAIASSIPSRVNPPGASGCCGWARTGRACRSTTVSGLHRRARPGDQATIIGDIVDLGDGSYEVTLTETGELGIDVFLITADDGIRPVVLPPRRATLELLPLFSDGFESGDTSAWSAIVP